MVKVIKISLYHEIPETVLDSQNKPTYLANLILGFFFLFLEFFIFIWLPCIPNFFSFLFRYIWIYKKTLMEVDTKWKVYNNCCYFYPCDSFKSHPLVNFLLINISCITRSIRFKILLNIFTNPTLTHIHLSF